MNKNFMALILALRSMMHKLCRDQNNEDLAIQAYDALDAYAKALKQHLAVYGEIIPESPEEIEIMKIMEE